MSKHHDFPSALYRYLTTRRAVAIGQGAAEVAISCFCPERHTNGDRNPSLRVDLVGGMWRCDVCGTGGGAIDLVMGYERTSNREEATKILVGDSSSSASPAAAKTTRRRGSGPGGRAKISPEVLREHLRRYRAALDAPAAAEILSWLERSWRVTREVLDAYFVGILELDPWAPPGWTPPPGQPIRTWALACPSTGPDFMISGIKLYRPRWKELGGDDGGKAHAERGSVSGIFGGHLVNDGDGAGRTIIIVGGEKDALIAAAAHRDLIVLANARGEGGWAGDRGRELAAALIATRPAAVQIHLDANEVERGTLAAVRAFFAAPAAPAPSDEPGPAPARPTIQVVEWPSDFVAAYPKGGVGQFLLDPRFGPERHRALVASARVVSEPPPADPSDPSSSSTSAPGGPGSSPSSDRVNPTDLGNARRLVALHGRDIRYVAASGKWHVWNRARWIVDATEEIRRVAERTVDALFAEAASAKGEEREKLFKNAMRAESKKSLDAMVALARSHAIVAAEPGAFDTNPWLFNVANGTLDLRTGILAPHRRDDMISKLAPLRYDPAAQCPTWLAFLSRVFDGRQDLVDFVHRAVGYSLAGSIREQVIFFLIGTGSNGKSTFLETLRALLGDYGQTADFSSFTERDKEVVRNDLADLAGARLVTAAETKSGQRLDEAVVKKLTGGDEIKARFLFREHFTYRPTFKIWLAANHEPVIKGGDHAIWRRIRLVPFEVTFADADRDKDMPEKLRTELSGILSWAVRGCLEWQRNGLLESEHVTRATEDYRDEMDSLALFMKERCRRVHDARMPAKKLYESYVAWCKESEEEPQTQHIFGRRVRERGFKNVKAHGVKTWVGITLREEGDQNGPRDLVGGSKVPRADAAITSDHARGQFFDFPEDTQMRARGKEGTAEKVQWSPKVPRENDKNCQSAAPAQPSDELSPGTPSATAEGTL